MRDLEQKVNRIMNRRSFKQWLSLPCLWTVALLTVQAQPVELEYAPDDGAVFNVVETVTRVTSVTGADPAVDPVTDVRMRESVVTIAAYVDPHSEDNPRTITTTTPWCRSPPRSRTTWRSCPKPSLATALSSRAAACGA